MKRSFFMVFLTIVMALSVNALEKAKECTIGKEIAVETKSVDQGVWLFYKGLEVGKKYEVIFNDKFNISPKNESGAGYVMIYHPDQKSTDGYEGEHNGGWFSDDASGIIFTAKESSVYIEVATSKKANLGKMTITLVAQ